VTCIGFIVSLFTILAFIPFLTFFVIWFIVYLIKHDKKLSTHIAMDITALLLLGKVADQLHKLTGSWFGFWLLVFIMLVATGLIGRKQNEIRGAVIVPRILKILLRIGFVVLSFFYVLLLIISIL
jgi:hypothetical protein